MDFACGNEDQVSWLQGIGLALDDIVRLAAQEQDYLVEVVVVEGNFLHGGIFQSKNPEIADKVAFLLIA